MPQTLKDYIDSLDARADFNWPQAPQPVPIAARPLVKPIEGIRAVLWNLYGTLLRISDGEFLQFHFKPARMQAALEQTIVEFKMAAAIPSTSGAAWSDLYEHYKQAFEAIERTAGQADGEFQQVDSTCIWMNLINPMVKRGYRYDESIFGDQRAFANKVAYFFHSCFQGVTGGDRALRTVATVSKAKLTQGLLADAQGFGFLELERCLRKQGQMPELSTLFEPTLQVVSHEFGLRKPSRVLYEAAVRRLAAAGIQPRETLYVSTRLSGDLAVAREYGFRTVLFAGDKTSLKATVTELNHPDLKPKRLITDLTQVCQIIAPAQA